LVTICGIGAVSLGEDLHRQGIGVDDDGAAGRHHHGDGDLLIGAVHLQAAVGGVLGDSGGRRGDGQRRCHGGCQGQGYDFLVVEHCDLLLLKNICDA
jgi:hypothetical protein